jgi:hypothetical protein
MNKTEKLSLIEGSFCAEEANEILMSIFSAKIHYHNTKNFSCQERSGKQDETAQKRIPALKNAIEKVSQIVSEATLHNKKLMIHSNIDITFLND